MSEALWFVYNVKSAGLEALGMNPCPTTSSETLSQLFSLFLPL